MNLRKFIAVVWLVIFAATCVCDFVTTDITNSIQLLDSQEYGFSLPICSTARSLGSLMVVEPDGSISTYLGAGNFVGRQILEMTPPAGKVLIRLEPMSVKCGGAVSIVLVQYSLAEISDPLATATFYRPHIIITRYEQPPSGFILQSFPTESELISAADWSLTSIASLEYADYFWTFDKDPLGQSRLTTYRYDSTVVERLGSIIVAADQGADSMDLIVLEHAKFLVLYSTQATAHFYSLNALVSVAYSFSINLPTTSGNSGCQIGKAVPLFDYLASTIDWLGLTLTCPGNAIRVVALKVDQTGTVTSSPYSRADLVSIDIGAIEVADTTVLAAYLRVERPPSSGSWVLSMSLLSLDAAGKFIEAKTGTIDNSQASIGMRLAFQGLELTNHDIVVLSRDLSVLSLSKATFSQPNCDSLDCILCHPDGCLVCPPNQYLFQGRCFTSLPLGTYSSNRFLETCLVAQCADCQSDPNDCSSCRSIGNREFYLFKTATTTTCVDIQYLDLPSGYGPNHASKTIQSCTEPKCEACSSDFRYCKRCQTDYWLIPSSYSCVLSENIPLGLGKLTSSLERLLAPCSLGNKCADCSTDAAVCIACATGLSTVILRTSPLILDCTLETIDSIRPGFGLSTGSTQTHFEPCHIAACIACSADSRSCQACASNRPLLGTVAQASLECLALDEVTAGFGQSGPASFEKCTVQNCLLCGSDFQKCTACQTGYLIYETLSSIQCIQLTTDSLYIGLMASDPLRAETCHVTECRSCTADSQSCQTCNPDRYLIAIIPGQLKCLSIAELPLGFGTEGIEAVPCKTAGCIDCKSAAASCATCAPGLYLHLLGASPSCLSLSEIPSGYGIFPDLFETVKCHDKRCENCSQNARICSACLQSGAISPLYRQPATLIDSNGILISISICVSLQEIHQRFGLPFGDTTADGLLLQCSETSCDYCRINHAICLDCSTGLLLDITVDPPRCTDLLNARPGSGRVQATSTIDYCVDRENCEVCLIDTQQCTKCLATSSKKFVRIDTLICEDGSSQLSGFGLDINAMTIAPCLEPGCSDCHADVGTCLACLNGRWLLTNSDFPAGRCIDKNDISSVLDSQGLRYGKQVGQLPNRLVTCTVYCESCPGNAAICQNCAQDFLLMQPNSCLSKSIIPPDGYGPSALSNPDRLLACSVSNCLLCRTVYGLCERCQPQHYLLITESTRSCIHEDQIPSGLGVEVAAAVPSLALCSVSGCDDCRSNHQTCSRCLPPYFLYQVAALHRCLMRSNFPIGWGIDMTNPVPAVVQCSSPYCSDCFSDSRKCFQCSSAKWLTADVPSICSAVVPLGQGRVGISQQLKKCFQAECSRCTADYSKCESCKAGYRVTSNGACVLCHVEGCSYCPVSALQCAECLPDFGFVYQASDLTVSCYKKVPDGFGIDPTSARLKRCENTACKTCAADYRLCQSCLTGSYLWSAPGKAECLTTPPSGYGKNPALNLAVFERCLISRCNSCPTDIAICDSCSSSTVFGPSYLYTDAQGLQQCLQTSEMPPGFGPSHVTFQAQACAMASCAECIDNYAQCTKCKTGYRLFRPPLAQAACISLTQTSIPTGFGVDTQSMTGIKACADRRCLDCSNDYTKCQSCLPEFFLYPAIMPALYSDLASTCVAYADMVPAVGMDGLFSRSLELCRDPFCKECSKTDTGACLVCTSSSYYYEMTDGKVECLGFDPTLLKPYPGYGLDGLHLMLKPCSPLCLECATDYQICTKCRPKDSSDNQQLYLSTDGSCLKASAIPEGQGPAENMQTSTESSALVPCSEAACADCRIFFENCKRCQSGFVLHSADQHTSCLAQSQLPPGFGLAVGVSPPSTIACKIPGCFDCMADASVCLSCGLNKKFLFNPDLGEIVGCLPDAPALLDLTVGGQVFGPSLGESYRFEPCTAHCASCLTAASNCQFCQRGYLLRLPELSCVTDDPSSFQPGTGKKLAADGASIIDACEDSRCFSCSSSTSHCEVCLPQTSDGEPLVELRWPTTAKTCYTAAELPDGFGMETGEPVARYCADENCLTCGSDYRVCTACKPGIFFLEHFDGSLECIRPEQLTTKLAYGKDRGALQLLPCANENCERCTADYQTCTGCMQGLVLDSRTNTCMSPNTKVAGFGIDVAEPMYPKLIPCRVRGCADCSTSATQSCSKCEGDLYLTIVGPAECVSEPKKGQGPVDIGSKQLIPCIEYCEKCPELYSICRKCNQGFILKNEECTVDIILPFQGYDASTSTITTCADTNCIECKSDVADCFRCRTGFVLHPTTKTCYSSSNKTAFPEAWGIDGFLLSKCQDKNCKRCSSSFEICELCQEDYFLYKVQEIPICKKEEADLSQVAVNSNSNKKVQSVASEPGQRGTLLSFKDTIPPLDYREMLLLKAYYSNGSAIDGVELTRADLKESRRDLHLQFKAARDVQNATVILLLRPQTLAKGRLLLENPNPFAEGVRIENVSIFYGEIERNFEKASIFLAVFLCFMTIVGFYIGPFYGYMILYYHTLLASLLLTSISKPFYWSTLLKSVSWTLVSLIPLPKAPSGFIKCSNRSALFFTDFGCFIYDNLNTYLVIFGALLLMKSFLQFAIKYGFISGKKHSKEPDFFAKLNGILDVAFFARYFIAVMPFWLYFSCLNLYYGAPSRLMAFGMVLGSIVMIIYVGLLSFACFLLYKAPSLGKDDAWNSVATILNSQISDRRRLKLFAPIANFGKTVVYCLVVAFCQESVLTQAGINIAVFAGHLAYLISVRPYCFWATNISICSIEALFCLIFALDLAQLRSTLTLTNFQTQYLGGYLVLLAMIVLILVLWLICLLILRKKAIMPEQGENKNQNLSQVAAKEGELDNGNKAPVPMEVPRSIILRREQEKERIAKDFNGEKKTETKNLEVHRESARNKGKIYGDSDSRANLFGNNLKNIHDSGMNDRTAIKDDPERDMTKKSYFDPLPPLLPKKKAVMGKVKLSSTKQNEEQMDIKAEKIENLNKSEIDKRLEAPPKIEIAELLPHQPAKNENIKPSGETVDPRTDKEETRIDPFKSQDEPVPTKPRYKKMNFMKKINQEEIFEGL
jgi:hypothetical protein